MFRSITTFGLILTFIVALQNNSEYWVINRALCLEKATAPCSATPDACNSDCRENPQCSEADVDCAGSYTGSRDCNLSDTRPFCFQFTCEKQSQSLPCCILIHPFWGEAQSRLNLTPDHSVALLSTADQLHKLSCEQAIAHTVNPDPPWGVHPIIATTVLRI